MSTQPKFFEMPNDFHLPLWKDYGRQLLKAHGQMQWDIGDWLIEGEDEGKLSAADLKRHALTATKYRWAWQTLKNFKVTARAIPPSRRRDGQDGRPELSYSMHVEIAKFEDAEIQEKLLAMATTERSLALGRDHMEAARFKRKDGSEDYSYHVSVPMSVKDLKTRIRDMQKQGELPKTTEKPSAPPEPTQRQPWKRASVMPVKFTRTHHQFLMAVVSGRGRYGPHGARDLVEKIVCDYIQQNLSILMEDAKKHDAGWGTLRPELSRILSQEKSPEAAPPQVAPGHIGHLQSEAGAGHGNPMNIDNLPFSPDGNPNGPLVIIPCAATKIWRDKPDSPPTPAEFAYDGPSFRANRRYARMVGHAWLVLSAKHGFITPQTVIESYDATFANPGPDLVTDIALREQALLIAEQDKFIVCLGTHAYNERVEIAFAGLNVDIHYPLKGIGSHHSLQWVTRHTNHMPEGGWDNFRGSNSWRKRRQAQRRMQTS
jgi:hypothetical protein